MSSNRVDCRTFCANGTIIGSASRTATAPAPISAGRNARCFSTIDDPEHVRDREQEDVHRRLRMPAEDDRRADRCRHREARVRPPLDEQIDLVQHRRQKAGRGALREMQPRHDERTESVRDRGDAARQHAVSPPAIEKRKRQRDEHLHRRLGRHRVAERQRQRENPQRRKGRALRVAPATDSRIPPARSTAARARSSTPRAPDAPTARAASARRASPCSAPCTSSSPARTPTTAR